MNLIPERPAIQMLRLPGGWTVVAGICSIALMTSTGLILANFKSRIIEPILLVALFACFGMFMWGAWQDRKIRHRRLSEELKLHGFERPSMNTNIDALVYEALRQMEPNKLGGSTEKLVLVGETGGREVVVSQHRYQQGKQSIPMLVVAVLTVRQWIPSIVRRRNLIDRFKHDHDLGHEAFDAQREVVAERWADALDEIRPLADWFVTEDHQRFSFKLREIPGKREQWSFCGHWAVRAEPGAASADDIIQSVRFMVAFAEAADDADMAANERA